MVVCLKVLHSDQSRVYPASQHMATGILGPHISIVLYLHIYVDLGPVYMHIQVF